MNDICKVLSIVQKNLIVPKNRINKFTNYNYRHCDDILEAVKKIMPDDGYVSLSDDLVMIGERYYVKAIAAFVYKNERIEVSAFAREASEKKGNDAAQITGSTSSYARKYALNGLFAIDDSEDLDIHDNREQKPLPPPKATMPQLITKEQEFEISKLLFDSKTDSKKFLSAYKVETIAQMSLAAYENAKKKLNIKMEKAKSPPGAEYLGV